MPGQNWTDTLATGQAKTAFFQLPNDKTVTFIHVDMAQASRGPVYVTVAIGGPSTNNALFGMNGWVRNDAQNIGSDTLQLNGFRAHTSLYGNWNLNVFWRNDTGSSQTINVGAGWLEDP